MTEETSCTQRMIFGHNMSSNIWTTEFVASTAVYSSRHRDCFAVLISKMVNALEAVAKNEGGTWLHFNPSYISAVYEDVHPSFVAEGRIPDLRGEVIKAY